MKRTPLARRSPRRRAKRLSLRARKTLHPERFCAREKCSRPATRIGRCATHAKEHLDRMVRLVVITHDAKCEAAAWHAPYLACGGPLQVNHFVRREYLVVRWDRRNVFAGCRDFNLWTERHPLESERMFREWRGDEYENLRRLALAPEKPDYVATLRALAEAV